MRYKKIPNSLFLANRAKIVEDLSDHSVAIVHTNDEMPRNGDQTFNFKPSSDLFYLSGISQEKTVLVLCPNHIDEKLREILFIIRPNKSMEIWTGHKLSIEEAQDISGISTIKYIDEFESITRGLILESNNIYSNIQENPKFVSEIKSRDERFLKSLKNTYPGHNYLRLAPIITKYRLIKELDELSLMKTACDITNKAFHNVLQNLSPGVNEYEVEANITYEFLKNSAEGHAYAPIVASGKNACVLHYITNDKVCNDGDLLLMDFGAEYAYYAADCTRTIPVNGTFTKRQADVYNAVLRVMKRAIKLIVPGTTINVINKKVVNLIQKECILLGLFTEEEVNNQDPQSPLYFNYYMHGCCHFLGLDVHDVGSKDTVLEKGMVLTCEPGIYIEEENIGVRIENNILVSDEPIDLMSDIPREIHEIEAIMNNGI